MKTLRPAASSICPLFPRAKNVILCTVGGLFLMAAFATVHEASGQRATQEAGTSLGDVGQRFTHLTHSATWTLTREIPIQFRTYHPQGMTRVGDTFFLSSVEVTEPRRPKSGDKEFEQTPGAGRAHLFRINAQGERTGAVHLGEGAMYHPGGIDYDGHHVWVPVAEYRPDSRSIIYRVDPETMEATAVLRADDHIGAVVYDASQKRLHGVNWSAKRFYTWDLSGAGSSSREFRPPSSSARNGSQYIAYQDCQFVAPHFALCGGLRDYQSSGGDGQITLGGLELVDVEAGMPTWQLPLPLYAAQGVPMTRNPFYAAPEGEHGLRFYFVPEDDRSTIYVYDVPSS